MRLQTILLPQQDICPISDLYYHKYTDGQIDFDGYFNLFQIKKHKKYTDIQGLTLFLSAPGFKRLVLMHDRKEVAVYDIGQKSQNFYVNDMVQTVDKGENSSTTIGGDQTEDGNQDGVTSESGEYSMFRFPYDGYDDGVFWFRLYYDDAVAIDLEQLDIRGFLDGEIQEPRNVNIAVDICTFKREPYVYRNMKSLMTMVEDAKRAKEGGDTLGQKEVSEHLRVFLVDNGQTLSEYPDMKELVEKSQGIIRIFPNKNYGGAAGFTRGMLEALDHKAEYGLTHVLLMDDDAVFDPDAFVRAYGFLTTVKEEYRDMRLGGTLIREDYQNIIYACGEKFENLTVNNRNIHTDISKYENCVQESLLGTKYDFDSYSGWWCCCYPIHLIENNPLPLPVFIHFDDISYEMQVKDTGVVFLNGIGAWHKGFELTFLGVNVYYNMRNSLINAALFQNNLSALQVKKEVFRLFTLYIMRYQYVSLQLAYQGLLDFLKGPNWLYQQDAERLNNRLRKLYGEQFPLRSIDEVKLPETIRTEIEQYRADYGLDEIEHVHRPNEKYPKKNNILKKLTFNGWFLPAKRDMISHACTQLVFDVFRGKKVAFFEPANDKVVVVEKDYRELWNYVKMLIKANKAIDAEFEKAKESYRRDLGKYTTKESWKKYLGI